LGGSTTATYANIYSDNDGVLVLGADAGNNAANSYFGIEVDSSERMRIDSSGNLLVGKAVSDLGATAGIELNGQYDVGYFTRSAEKALVVNRLSTDGTIADFRKDGTTVGSIGVWSSSLLVGTGDVGLAFVDDTPERIQPRKADDQTNADGLIDLGHTNNRFKDLYLSGGVYLGGTGSANKLDDYETGSWTPVITANTGSISSYTASGTYTKIGNSVVVMVDINIANIGTAGGFIRVATLPFSAITSVLFSGFGRERNATGYNLSIDYWSQTEFIFQKYDGSFLGGNGYKFLVTAVYEAA